MSYVLQGFGVFLGVLAGAAVTLLVQWVVERRKEKQKVKNLKFELEFDIRKIDKFLDEITRYRNAVNGETLDTYAGYFDLSRIICVTANDMFLSGLLYKYLSHDDIGKLQVIFSEFSINGENYINNQISQNKANFDKKKAVMDVDFWEKKFKEHKQTLQDIVVQVG